MRSNYLRARHHRKWGAEPGLQPEYVPESEADRARRQMREWLRTETAPLECWVDDDEWDSE